MKYLFTIMLFLLSFFAVSQTTKSVVLQESNYNNWYQCQESGRGKPSFFVSIGFTGKKANDGFYYYDVFFFNNSLYENGKECSTYIKNLKYYVWYNNKWVLVFTQDYALVKPKTTSYDGIYHAVYVYNLEKIKKIKITWGETYTY